MHRYWWRNLRRRQVVERPTSRSGRTDPAKCALRTQRDFPVGKTTKTVWVVAAALVLVVAWLASVMYSRIPPSAAAALESFYRRDVAEDQLMDPLILAGADVIPLLERDLLNPEMPRRRYAIGALGNIGEPSALPILVRIVQTGSEADYIRCDALSAVARIDRRAADQLIRAAPSLERECQMWLDSGSPKRGYLKALLGWHD